MNENMSVSFDDGQPLDLSMPKPSKPFYILDSDEEAETIAIDSDDDDDNKAHTDIHIEPFETEIRSRKKIRIIFGWKAYNVSNGNKIFNP